MARFAVTEVGRPRWDDSLPMRGQHGWTEHAAFMDALVEEGFVVLGGPIGDGRSHRILLIVEAVEPWTVLLGEPRSG